MARLDERDRGGGSVWGAMVGEVRWWGGRLKESGSATFSEHARDQPYEGLAYASLPARAGLSGRNSTEGHATYQIIHIE
jgi:hypothetical protein